MRHGDIDYAGMGNADLIQCLQNVDGRRYPDNFQRIVAEMERRGLHSLVSPYLPTVRTSHGRSSEPEAPEMPENRESEYVTEYVWRRKPEAQSKSDFQRWRKDTRFPAMVACGAYFLVETYHALGFRGKGEPHQDPLSFSEYLSNLKNHWPFLVAGFLVVLGYRYFFGGRLYGRESAICDKCGEVAHPRRIGQTCNCGGTFEDLVHWRLVAETRRRRSEADEPSAGT